MNVNDDPHNAQCHVRNYSSGPGPPILWVFQGIPFNIGINIIGLLGCVLVYLLTWIITRTMRKRGKAVFAIHRVPKTGGRLPTIYESLKMPACELVKHAGLDGIAYLRSLVFAATQLMTMAPFLFIASPIYYRGGEADTSYARLTISNLGMQDKEGAWVLLGATICCILLYFISTVIRLVDTYRWPRKSSFTRKMEASSFGGSDNANEPYASGVCRHYLPVNPIPSVLMLEGVSEKPEAELRRDLEQYLTALDSDASIQWIHYIRDLSNLAKWEYLRRELTEFLKLSREEMEQTGKEPEYHTRCCDCCCCNPALSLPKDAIEAYTVQLEDVQMRLEETRKTMNLDQGDSDRNHCRAPFTGLVLVGLNSPAVALSVAKTLLSLVHQTIPTMYILHPASHKSWLIRNTLISPTPEAVRRLKVPFRELLLAPPPEDLIWTNLMKRRDRGSWWTAVKCLRSVGIFVLALLLTSPSYLLMALNYISHTHALHNDFSFFVYQWVPALVLVGASALVKLLVIYSEALANHGTYSGQEKVGQRRLFMFLVVTVLVLPSLGVSGVPAIIIKIFNSTSDEGGALRLECIFLPDSSVLFINYVITCSLLGSGLTLMQLGRIFYFLIKRWFCCIHSSAEAKLLARENAGPFPYRERYASMALIQTIAVAYAPVAPIIIPCGLFYFLCDYFTCKYALVRIYHSDWREDGRGTSLESPYSQSCAKQIYRLNWSIQAALSGLTGICLAAFNLFGFFLLRVKVLDMREPLLAYFVLCLATPIMCILLVFIVSCRLARLSYLCERESDNREPLLFDDELESDVSTQCAYTNPLLRETL